MIRFDQTDQAATARLLARVAALYGPGHWILANLAQHESSMLNAVHPHSTRESVSVSKWHQHLVTFAVLILSIGTVTHLPSLPYNVKELIEPGIYGVFSVIGLSLAIQWLVNGHFMFLNRCNRIHGQMLYLPLWLITHGIVTWVLLRLSVPMESIHDIVGAPVLGWVWEWELIGRYLALHGAIALRVIGATVLLAILRGKYRLEVFLTWIIWSILLAWPIYWIVATRAAADKITELMLGGGTFASSTLLASGFFFLLYRRSHFESIGKQASLSSDSSPFRCGFDTFDCLLLVRDRTGDCEVRKGF